LDQRLHYDVREGLEPNAPLRRGLAIGTGHEVGLQRFEPHPYSAEWGLPLGHSHDRDLYKQYPKHVVVVSLPHISRLRTASKTSTNRATVLRTRTHSAAN